MKQFPRLFHKTSKGKINIWDVWADGDSVYTRWGQINGKQQESSQVCTPKNVGRANTTTAEEQAELEAQSLWTHKLERKYYKSQEEAENEIVFLPMLASSFEKRRKFVTEGCYPAHMQPKLDGVRCMAFWEDDSVKLMSRAGKEYILPHISTELETVLPKNIVFDGELYIHGVSLQELNSLVRRTKTVNPESEKVEYHVYDCIVDKDLQMNWINRVGALADALLKTEEVRVKVLGVVPETVWNEEQVFQKQAEFVAAGYEGGILRLHGGVYRLGYRSKELLKVKSFMDEEFEIVDFSNGVGKFETCIIYTCKTAEGKTFNVVPKGTFEQREQWLQEGNSHIGKMLKVQFAAWTEDQIPQFPVGLCIRLEEDM